MVEIALVEFVARIQKMMDESLGEHAPKVIIEVGPKYVRVVRHRGEKPFVSEHSAYCFVEKETGNIYKSKGYKGPEKNHVRGNILDERGGMGWLGPYGIACLR